MKRKYTKPASLLVTLYAENPLLLNSVTGNVNDTDTTTDTDQTSAWSQSRIWDSSSSSSKDIWGND